MSSKGASATSTKSVQRAINDLSKFIKNLDTVPVEELSITAERIKEQAIAQVPYKTGRLERSIYVTVSKDKNRPGLRAGASARDPDTGYNYAGVQHENVDYQHPIKGKAHFISDPFKKEIRLMIRRINRRLKIK